MRRLRPLLLALALVVPAVPAAPAAAASSTVASASAVASTTPVPAPTYTPNPAASDGSIGAAADAGATGNGDAGTPLPLVLLAVLGGLMLLAALAFGAARWWAWDPRWLQRSRHAGAEAGWRAGAAWEEFTDWLRIGR